MMPVAVRLSNDAHEIGCNGRGSAHGARGRRD